MKQHHFFITIGVQKYNPHHLYDWGWLPHEFPFRFRKNAFRLERHRTLYNFGRFVGHRFIGIYCLITTSIIMSPLAPMGRIPFLYSYFCIGLALGFLLQERRTFLRINPQ